MLCRKNGKKFCLGVVLFFVMGSCICCSRGVQQGISEGIVRCVATVIPSLYAMMIVTQMLIVSGSWRLLGKPFSIFPRGICGLSGSCFGVFLMSQLAGYPVGISMLCRLTEQGVLSRQQASRLSLVCYGSGPAFLAGLLGNGGRKQYLLILCCNVLANLILAWLLFHKQPVAEQEKPKAAASGGISLLLVECTATAGSLLWKLCGVILCFSAGMGILEQTGLFRLLAVYSARLHLPVSLADCVPPLLEISCAVDTRLPGRWLLPFLAFAISFGGICVLFQLAAAGGQLFRWRQMLLCRLAAGSLSALLCRLGLQLFPELCTSGMVTAASAPAYAVRPFPAVMLGIMIFFLFYQSHQIAQYHNFFGNPAKNS